MSVCPFFSDCCWDFSIKNENRHLPRKALLTTIPDDMLVGRQRVLRFIGPASSHLVAVVSDGGDQRHWDADVWSHPFSALESWCHIIWETYFPFPKWLGLDACCEVQLELPNVSKAVGGSWNRQGLTDRVTDRWPYTDSMLPFHLKAALVSSLTSWVWRKRHLAGLERPYGTSCLLQQLTRSSLRESGV